MGDDDNVIVPDNNGIIKSRIIIKKSNNNNNKQTKQSTFSLLLSNRIKYVILIVVIYTTITSIILTRRTNKHIHYSTNDPSNSIQYLMTITNDTQQQQRNDVLTTNDDETNTKMIFNLSNVRRLYNNNNNVNNNDNNNNDNRINVGILSMKDSTFFHNIQNDIDNIDNEIRCQRYDGTYNRMNPTKRRRIFYGALIANESWELFEIISTEVYGLYSGVVLVEGNRTQNRTPRNVQRINNNQTKHIFQQLFGTNNIQIRLYSNEKKYMNGLAREHEQRSEIIMGWKKLGMKPEDIGIIADIDETFTRDFLHAVQVCDNIPYLDYNKHYCNINYVKLIASSRVYESSPECISDNRQWYHPSMIIGHCIDGIALDSSSVSNDNSNNNNITNNIHHPKAPRKTIGSFKRAIGWGDSCDDISEYNIIKNNTYPLWNAADFRRACVLNVVQNYIIPPKKKIKLNNTSNNNSIITTDNIDYNDNEFVKYDVHTGYHFHNFFSYNFNNTIRYKYYTYGHADKKAYTRKIEDFSNDLRMMHRCIMNLSIEPEQKWYRVIGGYNNTLPFYPIYFHDIEYRNKRHEHIKQLVIEDDKQMTINLKLEQEQVVNNNNNDITPTKSNEIRSDSVISNLNEMKIEQDSQIIRIYPKDTTIIDHSITKDDTDINLNHFDLSKSRMLYNTNDDNNIPLGVLSTKDSSFFRNIQKEIDMIDNEARCQRYGWTYNRINPTKRRIFYGALIANEPWELFEITATEVYGIYDGIVLVEGNRTQNMTPRKVQRLNQTKIFQQLFGVSLIQMRLHVSEGSRLMGLGREQAQRSEIILGWKELGMKPDDIGIIADSDETFTRDFLRAVQVCDDTKYFTYERHYCHFYHVKLIGRSRVYESTPECISGNRQWFHPDMIIGHCIDGIAPNDTIHPQALRYKRTFRRAPGWGDSCGTPGSLKEYKTVKNKRYPLWNAADYRATCAGTYFLPKTVLDNETLSRGPTTEVERNTLYDRYTGYHFHNFFNDFNTTRHKYYTYGHPDKKAYERKIEFFSNDMRMMHRCVLELPIEPEQKWHYIVGGYNKTFPHYPIYFQDDDYRKRRHEHVKRLVIEDDKLMNKLEGEEKQNIAITN